MNKPIEITKYNQFIDVPPFMKSVTDQEFNDTFLVDRQKVQDWVGVLFTQNLFDDQLSMPHDKLTNWLGSWGMGLTDISSYKAWTFDDYADKTKWERLVWRLFHIYPLGFLISRYKFYKLQNSGTWNPAVEPLSQFSRGGSLNMTKSNRHINGATIAQAMYMKIFGEISDFEDNASISLALYDVFSAKPNIDNPLFVTLRRAFKKTLCLTAYPLPYFWNDFILHLFGSVPSDYREVSHLITTQDNDPATFDLNKVIYKGDEPEVAQDDIKQSSPAPILVNDVVNEESPDEKLFNSLFNALCSKLTSAEYAFNGKGAVLHKIENHFFLVHPLWVNKLTKDNADETIAQKVIDYAVKSKKIALYSGHIDIPGNTGFPVQLALLHPNIQNLLPQSILSSENNTDIRIIKKNSAQSEECSH
jgi:hypothetical protein